VKIPSAYRTEFNIDKIVKDQLIPVFEYNSSEEVKKFSFLNNKAANRLVKMCPFSGHYYSIHDYKLKNIYSEEYNNVNYTDVGGVQKEFEIIINLTEKLSDNKMRVKNINNFFQHHKIENKFGLDVGSGIGVFPYEMKKTDWNIEVVDPDINSVNHISNLMGIKCYHTYFENLNTKSKFDLITFNKVIEHVRDPLSFLKLSQSFIKENGYVYIEVPDGTTASIYGQSRNEFALEHYHIFSIRSLHQLIISAGYVVEYMERLIEPSGKFTIRAVAKYFN
jgi:2-polyprenyl-3-methyl-5-hydroxy-6-metoxy-1,4-benzoquinol methylase